MKKLFAVLLAFALVAGAFAQVTTAIAASGTITLYDQDGKATFAPDGAGYDTFTFKATDKDGNFGFSMTDENWLVDASGALTTADPDGAGPLLPLTVTDNDGLFQIRDWNAWFKGQYTKVILGKLRNADFRGTLPNGIYANYFYGMDRISGDGLLIESTTLGALTLGVNLPVPMAGADFSDVLQMADIGAKYVIENIGTVYFLANLDLVADSNKIGFAFKYTGMEDLVASVVYKGTFATANVTDIAFGVDYTMDKLNVQVEFDGENATQFDGEFAAQVSYGLMDKLTGYVGGLYDLAGTYDAFVKAEYDYGNGIVSFVKAGYDADLYYSLGLTYSVSF